MGIVWVKGSHDWGSLKIPLIGLLRENISASNGIAAPSKKKTNEVIFGPYK